MDQPTAIYREVEFEELLATASEHERQRMRKEIEAQESSKSASLEGSK